MKNLKIILTIVVVLTTLVASAHPGHGVFDGFSIFHYLRYPLHISIASSLAIAVITSYYFLRKKRQQTTK